MSSEAQINSDSLLREILSTQTHLFQGLSPATNSGKAVADFVEALRTGLTAMYTKTPR